MDTNYFFSAVKVGNALFWTTRDNGDLMRFDIEQNKLEYVIADNYLLEDDMIYSTVLCSDDRHVYGLAKSGKYFFQYDTQRNVTDYWDANLEKYWMDLICYAKKIDNQIVVIACCKDALVRIDLEKRKCEERKLFGIELEKQFNICACDERKIYLLNQEAGKMIVMSPDGREEQVFALPANLGIIDDICVKAGRIYLITFDGKLYEWEFENETYVERCDISEYATSDRGNGRKEICCSKDCIWILFEKRDRALSICQKTYKVISVIGDENSNVGARLGYVHIKCAVKLEDNKKYYFPMINSNSIFVVDIAENKGTFLECPRFSCENLVRYANASRKKVFSEERITLGEYISCVSKV